ncbi:MAG TPA: endolytic transglycosylase MltG [Oscillospiraceae bacterium]|nr:endolytic transglycosylase MltG [Oscillospiraceae bacterium]HPS33720.1 endolytic transglycosylase MltG [Oscillospiraceae bacterium]
MKQTRELNSAEKGTYKERWQRFRRTAMGDLTVALFWVAGGIILGASMVGSFSDVLGIMKNSTQREVQVKAGWSTLDMAFAMKKAGVINHPWVFAVYTMLNDTDGTFKSGTYLLDGGMTYDKIISTIQRKQSSQTVRLTFTEGMNAAEIGAMLEENKVCLKSEFLKAVNTGAYNYDFIPAGGAQSGRFYRLEGYLFPDTYDFFINESVDSVIKKFLNNFNSKFTVKLRERAAEMGMTLDQAVTLASIIEKEAPDVFEMANVSAVFHNRLLKPQAYPKLQSNVTSYYVKNVIDKALTFTDPSYTQVYDTYVCSGLPVGPICNPGGAALTAALYPSATDYYYFVTDADGNFYYAMTLSQHNANISKASRVGANIGGTYTHD